MHGRKVQFRVQGPWITKTAPTRMHRSIPSLSFALCLLACEQAPSERDEARRFVAAVTDLNPAGTPEERHAQLLALQGLSLHFETLRATRDRCLEAHTGLMLAEAAQATARAELLLAQRGDAGLPPDVTDRVAKSIRRANDQLEVAKGASEHCLQETRALAVKYR